jgi:DNA-binding transcriptional ArsR family regulator
MVEQPFKTKSALKQFVIESAEEITDLLKSITHPRRLQILALMSESSCTLHDLLKKLDLQKSALANYLSILVDNNLVEKIDRGLYRITVDGEDLLERIAISFFDIKIREKDRLLKLQEMLNRYSSIEKEETNMENREHSVKYVPKSMNMIKGIRKLAWGTDKEIPFCGCIERVMEVFKEPYDYNDLMGLSGVAFKLFFNKNKWDFAAGMGSHSPFREQLLTAIGYDLLSIELENNSVAAREKMVDSIRKEIDSVRPILAFDLITPEDWGLIVGYVDDKLLVRTYNENPNKTLKKYWESIGWIQKDQGTIDDYYIGDNFPQEILVFRKTNPIINENEMIREALKFTVETMQRPEIAVGSEVYANGIQAYDRWIETLENDEYFNKLNDKELTLHTHMNAWVYDVLFDSRLAAMQFTNNINKKFVDKERKTLIEIRDIYKANIRYMKEEWKYFAFPFWYDKEKGKTWYPAPSTDEPKGGWHEGAPWAPEARKNGINVIKKLKTIDMTVLDKLSIFS